MNKTTKTVELEVDRLSLLVKELLITKDELILQKSSKKITDKHCSKILREYNKLKVKRETVLPIMSESSREVSLLESKIKSLNASIELEQIKVNKHIVDDSIKMTDHAVLRYMERVLNIDIDVLKDKIRYKLLTTGARTKIKSNKGSLRYAVGEYTVVCVDDAIVTILENKDER